jgi:hypothetical protein
MANLNSKHRKISVLHVKKVFIGLTPEGNLVV